MTNVVILLICCFLLGIEGRESFPGNDSGGLEEGFPLPYIVDVPVKQGVIEDIIWTITDSVKSTTGLINNIANLMIRDERLIQQLVEPLRMMLYYLNPKIVIDAIEDTFKVTNDTGCQDESIEGIMDDIKTVHLDPTETWKSVINAYEAYITIEHVKYRIEFPLSYEKQISDTLQIVLANIMSALIDYSNSAMNIVRSYMTNLETLEDLSSGVFTELLLAIREPTFKTLELLQDTASSLIKIRRSLTIFKATPLSRAVTGHLSTIRTFINNFISFVLRSSRSIGARKAELNRDITTWTAELATATGDDKTEIQAQIDDAKARIEKNNAVQAVLGDFRRYASIIYTLINSNGND